MKIKALSPWYGANRVMADRVGKHLGKLRWCGVPYCGGCCEIPYIDTSLGVANDLHRGIINLASVVREDPLREKLIKRLNGTLFHPDELAQAQRRAKEFACSNVPMNEYYEPSVSYAAAYFAAVWMGRGGFAGTRDELKQSLSVRWNPNGGDSAVRFRSAIESLDAWAASLQRWSFTCIDAGEFLTKVEDANGSGLYVDPPWPDAGERYRHNDAEDHAAVAESLVSFKRLRIVVRYGDHPLIRELYPKRHWLWYTKSSRNQGNNDVPEALIVRKDRS